MREYLSEVKASTKMEGAEGDVFSYILLANPGYCPCHAQEIAGRIKEAGLKPVVVRISTRTVQIYTKRSLIPELERIASRVLGLPRIPREPVPECESIDCLFDEYTMLLGEELFWEAHEVAEAIWRLGSPQGHLLAVAAGVLAKAQEGVFQPLHKITSWTLHVVRMGQAGVGQGVDYSCMVSEAEKILACGRPEAVKCITRPAITISYRRK